MKMKNGILLPDEDFSLIEKHTESDFIYKPEWINISPKAINDEINHLKVKNRIKEIEHEGVMLQGSIILTIKTISEWLDSLSKREREIKGVFRFKVPTGRNKFLKWARQLQKYKTLYYRNRCQDQLIANNYEDERYRSTIEARKIKKLCGEHEYLAEHHSKLIKTVKNMADVIENKAYDLVFLLNLCDRDQLDRDEFDDFLLYLKLLTDCNFATSFVLDLSDLEQLIKKRENFDQDFMIMMHPDLVAELKEDYIEWFTNLYGTNPFEQK